MSDRTIASLIRKMFNGEEVSLDDLEEYYYYLHTKDMISFTRSLTVFAGMSCIYGGTVSGKTVFLFERLCIRRRAAGVCGRDVV